MRERVAARKKDPEAWPFPRKFPMWLADHSESMAAFARRSGVPQPSLHAYTKQGRKMPADVVGRIAIATKLPADYWLNDRIPYPPPADYANAAEDIARVVRTLPLDLLQEALPILRDENELRRTLALRRLAATWPARGPGSSSTP